MTDLKQEHEIRAMLREQGEKNLYIAGCDEAGRGAYAGPLVAAAVILPDDIVLDGITDSKKISKTKHKEYMQIIMDNALAIGLGIVEPLEIDRYGVGQANKLAIERAVADLPIEPAHILIDGASQQVIKSQIPQTQVVKGDLKSLSMASASIVAKTIRDELMKQYGEKYPEYGWDSNAGYGTNIHTKAIESFGITEHHRKSFKPIRDHIQKTKLTGGMIE